MDNHNIVFLKLNKGFLLNMTPPKYMYNICLSLKKMFIVKTGLYCYEIVIFSKEKNILFSKVQYVYAEIIVRCCIYVYHTK